MAQTLDETTVLDVHLPGCPFIVADVREWAHDAGLSESESIDVGMYAAGFEAKEIADIRNVTEWAVRQNLFRARRKLDKRTVRIMVQYVVIRGITLQFAQHMTLGSDEEG